MNRSWLKNSSSENIISYIKYYLIKNPALKLGFFNKKTLQKKYPKIWQIKKNLYN
jgi:hypothetical protein